MFAFVIAVAYVLLCYIGPSYDGTKVYSKSNKMGVDQPNLKNKA